MSRPAGGGEARGSRGSRCSRGLGLLARLAALVVLDALDALGLSRLLEGRGRLGAWGFRGALFPLHGRDALSVTPAVQDA